MPKPAFFSICFRLAVVTNFSSGGYDELGLFVAAGWAAANSGFLQQTVRLWDNATSTSSCFG
jgi:hypothetical protein